MGTNGTTPCSGDDSSPRNVTNPTRAVERNHPLASPYGRGGRAQLGRRGFNVDDFNGRDYLTNAVRPSQSRLRRASSPIGRAKGAFRLHLKGRNRYRQKNKTRPPHFVIQASSASGVEESTTLEEEPTQDKACYLRRFFDSLYSLGMTNRWGGSIPPHRLIHPARHHVFVNFFRHLLQTPDSVV